MASDSLKQVGKTLGKAGRDADRAIKKEFPIKPRLERVRDEFDSSIDLEMEFVIEETDGRVLLDLFFNLPPPIRGCKVGCIFTKCEEFEFESGGNLYITLQNPYIIGTVSVFINGDKIPDYQMAETSPSSGEVFFQGTSGPDTVSICYIYSDCPLCIFDWTPSFIGATLLFSDRFDKAASSETWGGLGGWYQNINPPTSDEAPYIVTPTNGAFVNNSTAYYKFEEHRAAGITSETMMAVDLSFLEPNASLFFRYRLTNSSRYASSPFFTIQKESIQINVPYRGKIQGGSNLGVDYITQTFFPPTIVSQTVFIRFFVSLNTWQLKIWPFNEDEPTDWLQFTAPLPSGGTWISGTVEWEATDYIGGEITNGTISAIEHWGGLVSGNYGTWDYVGADNSSWQRDVSHYFGGNYWDSPESENIYEFGTSSAGANSHITETFPTYSLLAGWNQFDAQGQGYPIGISQSVKSWDNDYGKTLDIRITGEVRWTRHSETVATPPLTIQLHGFSYGANGPPPIIGDAFQGTILQSVHAPFEEWQNFQIIVPAVDGKIQWGCKFTEDEQSIVDGLDGYAGSFFLQSTSLVEIQFRNVVTDAVTAPIGGAVPPCVATGFSNGYVGGGSSSGGSTGDSIGGGSIIVDPSAGGAHPAPLTASALIGDRSITLEWSGG